MKRALLITLMVIPGIGLAVLLLGRGPQAQAERNVPVPVKWEYKVVTFSGTDTEMTKKLTELNDEGWEYVGLVASPYYVPGAGVLGRGAAHDAGSVALRRLKK
jgi:hypothetical protein